MQPGLTPRERFIAALNRQPLAGRVPHFELVFFLTMEAFSYRLIDDPQSLKAEADADVSQALERARSFQEPR